MNCPLCGNTNALEDLSFGGGLRVYCEPCGGFYRISSTLHTLAEGKTYDTERARTRLIESLNVGMKERLLRTLCAVFSSAHRDSAVSVCH